MKKNIVFFSAFFLVSPLFAMERMAISALLNQEDVIPSHEEVTKYFTADKTNYVAGSQCFSAVPLAATIHQPDSTQYKSITREAIILNMRKLAKQMAEENPNANQKTIVFHGAIQDKTSKVPGAGNFTLPKRASASNNISDAN